MSLMNVCHGNATLHVTMTDSFVDSLRWRNDVLLVGAVLDLAGAAAVAAAVACCLLLLLLSPTLLRRLPFFYHHQTAPARFFLEECILSLCYLSI